MTEKEKMLAGMLYLDNDAELVKDREKGRLLTEIYNKTSVKDGAYRTELLKKLLGKTGEHLTIEPNFKCDYGSNIYVGENFYANYDCIILDVCNVVIGKNCMLAPRVCIFTATHPLNAKERCSGSEFGKPIIIGDNVWIGGNSVINPGVKIGNNVVVGSGSVVTKDVPDNACVAGNPARIIKMIDNN